MSRTEYTAPDSFDLPRTAHLLEPVLEWAEREPDRAIAAYRDGDRFVDVSWREMAATVRRYAKGLIGLGVTPGDRVALMSHTRLEWPQLDYAILAAGGVTVPIYETSSADQVEWIVGDSEAVAFIVETAELRALYDGVAERLPTCRRVLVIDEGGLAELEEAGSQVGDDQLDERIDALTTNDLATIIYTSGTTGRPKGCVLTHGNLRANVRQQQPMVTPMLQGDDSSLLFLPLAHSLAKIICLIGMELGIKGYFATSMQTVAEELPMANPTLVVSVPRVFEKVYNGAVTKAEREGKGRIFAKAADVAIDWSRAGRSGSVPLGLRLQHALFDRLVYGKVRGALGGRLRFAFSGGAPLGERLTHFFHGIGVRVYEGYGLTETSPTLTLNVADAWRIGTTGRPVPGTTIRIAEDGEVLAKGPQIFQGYWKNAEATAETIDADGWFHTGDLGELTDDGYLAITGRKKDLIVTAAGKNVAPEPMEDSLRSHPLISQAMIVGDGKPFIGALIAIDEEAFTDWAAAHGHEHETVRDLVDDPELRAEIQAAVDLANTRVSKAEAIKQFVILPRDLTIEGGELTPTMKVKRRVLVEEYGSFLEQIYT